MARLTKAEKETRSKEAVARLLKMIKPGDTVRTVLTYRSSSGMSRRIKVLVYSRDNLYKVNDGENIRDISGLIADALGYRWHDEGSVVVGGCGMDMGFHVVYSLSSVLFRDNFYCVGERCPSNDHFNGDKNYKRHKHSSGGYALRHQWL